MLSGENKCARRVVLAALIKACACVMAWNFSEAFAGRGMMKWYLPFNRVPAQVEFNQPSVGILASERYLNSEYTCAASKNGSDRIGEKMR